MQTKLERRLTVECAWCHHQYVIPAEWAGDICTCQHCGARGRAYGYLSGPEPVVTSRQPDLGEQPLERVIEETDFNIWHDPDPNAYDCRGGLIAALISLAGFWAVIGSMIHWWWS